MAIPIETEVEFPKSQRDLFPAAAQQLYVETYKQSFAESTKGNSNQLSHDSVAARDAWDAVKCAYEQDDVTHKWRAIAIASPGGQADAQAGKDSFLGAIKRLFKR